MPKQVIRFLNDEKNRSLIRGVIGAGNTNFGEAFCLAGDIIAAKCKVPHLYRFEVFGTPDDVRIVHEGLETFWKQQLSDRLATTAGARDGLPLPERHAQPLRSER